MRRITGTTEPASRPPTPDQVPSLGSSQRICEASSGAWKYVQWLSEPETQQGFYDEVGDLPAVKAAWDSGELADDPQLQVFGQQLDSALAPPAVPTWEQVAAAVDSEIEKATKGGEDVSASVSAMQKQAESIGTGL